MLIFPLRSLPDDILFVLTNEIMEYADLSQQDRFSYLLADPKMRKFNIHPGIKLNITDKRLLRELYAAATLFRLAFPSSSFSNIWLLQTTIPRKPELRSMLSDIFRSLPSITQLNISFDRLSDFSLGAFGWLEQQAQHLQRVEVLRVKYGVDSEMLKAQNTENPWLSSIPVVRFLVKMEGLRTVVLRTPLLIALQEDAYAHLEDIKNAREQAWVRSWADHLPLIKHVYLAHAFDDDIGEFGIFDSGRRNAFLKRGSSDWVVKSWWPDQGRHPIKYHNNVHLEEYEQDPYDSDT